ncbi:MAG: SIMPL domain-containing protein [Candidatus Portnoybacteria bacterium]|nr:SIMPL domain-containing protein [Candidatus Portnoybacteria bacterium]
MDIINANSPSGKSLRPAISVFLAILLLSAAFFLILAGINEVKKNQYIGQDIERKNSITINGEGKIFAKPDIGQISLSVITEAKSVADAQKNNNEKMNKIIETIEATGVDEKDIKTANYNIYPKYQYTYGKSVLIGYEVSQTLEIKIRNLDKFGEIIAKATENGANQVGSLTFTFDDPEKLKTEARQKAIENAREKAEALADALKVDLVRIIDFSESSSEPPVPYSYSYKEAYGVGGGGDTASIQTGQNEIIANVSITYEIK